MGLGRNERWMRHPTHFCPTTGQTLQQPSNLLPILRILLQHLQLLTVKDERLDHHFTCVIHGDDVGKDEDLQQDSVSPGLVDGNGTELKPKKAIYVPNIPGRSKSVGWLDTETSFCRSKASAEAPKNDSDIVLNGKVTRHATIYMVLLLVDGCISCNNPAGMGSALNLSVAQKYKTRRQAVVCPGYLNYYKHTTVQLEEGNASSSFMYGVVLMERLCPMVGIAGVLPNETNLVMEPLDYKYEISLVVTHNCTGEEKNVSLKFPTIDVFTTDQTMHDRIMQIRGLKLELDTLEDGVLDLSDTDNMDLNGHFILAAIASEENGPTMPPPSPNDDGTEMPPMNNGTGQPLEPYKSGVPFFLARDFRHSPDGGNEQRGALVGTANNY
ncbi:hypothetical protein GPALN_002146 [Globodera pallida]|nr:hypothetical protein GPALN_002146 [Globodera pallida]